MIGIPTGQSDKGIFLVEISSTQMTNLCQADTKLTSIPTIMSSYPFETISQNKLLFNLLFGGVVLLERTKAPPN